MLNTVVGMIGSTSVIGGGMFFISQLVFTGRYRKNYFDHPQLFLCWFACGCVVMLTLFWNHLAPYASHATPVVLLLGVVGYCLFCRMLGELSLVDNACELLAIPETQTHILQKKWTCGLVKSSEVCFQQLCALVILTGLVLLEYSPVMTALLFSACVGVLHIGALTSQGKVFGTVFTMGAMSGSFGYCFAFMHGFGGIGTYVLAHLSLYVALFTVVFYKYRPKAVIALT